MNLAYKFKFFDNLVWIDSNYTISLELNQFIMIYGNQFQFYQSPQNAKKIVDSNPNSKFLLMCNSKVFVEVCALFSQQKNVYPKFIVFCGLQETINHMQNTHPFKNAVQKAFCQVGDIIHHITSVDIATQKNPAKLSEKIKIDQNAISLGNVNNQMANPNALSTFFPNFQLPTSNSQNNFNSSSTSYAYQANQQNPSGSGYNSYSFNNESSPYMKTYTNNAAGIQGNHNAIVNSSKNEAGVKISEKAGPQTKKKDIKKQKKKIERVFPKETKICWVLGHEISKSQDQDLKKNYFQELENNGYPIDLLQSAQFVTNYVQQEIFYNYIIIAIGNVNIYDVKSSTNNNLGVIRLCRDDESQYQSIDDSEEIVVRSFDEMLKQLKRISTEAQKQK